MPKKIPLETIKLIEELYAQNLSLKEIAQRAHVSKTTIYVHTKLKERGFTSGIAYKKYLAEKNGFASLNESEIYLAQERSYLSRIDYEKNLVQERDFASYADYKKHLAQKQGFASRTEYETHLAQQRQQRPGNMGLSNLITTRLEELGKTQLWLSGELGVTPQSICKYTNGTTIPKPVLQERLFQVLDLPYKTIDDFLRLE